MVVFMSSFGLSLATRETGRDAYLQISDAMKNPDTLVTFDFTDVITVTNSFADEVFGRLAMELGMDELRKRTRFVNISPMWAKVIRGAMDQRAAMRELVAS